MMENNKINSSLHIVSKMTQIQTLFSPLLV